MRNAKVITVNSVIIFTMCYTVLCSIFVLENFGKSVFASILREYATLCRFPNGLYFDLVYAVNLRQNTYHRKPCIIDITLPCN